VDTRDLEAAILKALRRFGTLPESDLVRQLAPGQLARYEPAVLDTLATAGQVTVRHVGDERVITLVRPTDAAPGSRDGER
jgi:hypothetical protein